MHENPGPKKFGDFLGGYFVGKILRVALWRRRFLAAPAARNIPRRFLEGALVYSCYKLQSALIDWFEIEYKLESDYS